MALLAPVFCVASASAAKINASSTNFSLPQAATHDIQIQLTEPIICPGNITDPCEVSLTLTSSDPTNVNLSTNNVVWMSYEWAQSRTITITTANSSVYASPEPVTIQAVVDGNTTAPYYLNAGFNIAFTLINTNPATYPTLTNQTATTPYNTPVTADVLTGVSNNPDPSTLAITVAPTQGTAAVVAGTILYTPTPGYVGSDGLTYLVCSSLYPEICSTATLSLSVQAAAGVPTTTSTLPTAPVTGYGKPISVTPESAIAQIVILGMLLTTAFVILRRPKIVSR